MQGHILVIPVLSTRDRRTSQLQAERHTHQGTEGLVYLQWVHQQQPITVGFIFQGSSVCQVTAIGVTVILLYTSRACYNLFILSFSQIKNVHSFDYDWYNVSDQVSGGMTGCCCSGPRAVGCSELLPHWGPGLWGLGKVLPAQ